MVMVMNDPLPPPLCNVNQSSHCEILLFQNLTMKIHGQGHVWLKVKVTSDLQIQRPRLWSTSNPLVTWSRSNPLVTFEAWSSDDMFAFRFVQSDHFWMRYRKFHIWPWKFKVKVMAKVKPDGHIWGLEFSRYVCFSFRGNRTILGWDIANSIFDLENSRSRSWPRSHTMVTFEP